ncbi:CDP-glycerol glycerophosphotransferase family protein [Halalkalibacter alkalisediminis]|uniref:CDP-glycerol glycerophosphotransferase family protein n=1 Tax=Halalkalibacter alkalisediminis TaxID=935616 RepID=A0ABV6NER2_9BACI|nr:CDP-glycerol glycerophosphotransferase family protein [Halalkalibacter alkalisediminis]
MLTNFFPQARKKHRSAKTKKRFIMIQDQAIIHIHGLFSNISYQTNELIMRARGSKNDIKLGECERSHRFSFRIDLRKLISRLQVNEKRMYDFYIRVSVDKEILSEEEIDELPKGAQFIRDKNKSEKVEYCMRLGEFEQMVLKNVELYTYKDQRGLMYVTQKGNISFAFNKEPNTIKRTLIYQIDSKRNVLHIKGKLFTRNSKLLKGTVLLKARGTGKEIEVPFTSHFLKKETEQNYGLNRYQYHVALKLDQINHFGILDEDTYDVYLKLTLHDHKKAKMVRLRKPTYQAKYLANEGYGYHKDRVSVVNPYFTFKKSNLSLEVVHFSKSTFRFLNLVTQWAWLLRKLFARRDVWLIGERTYKAQDTGYHFFRYMRENHPRKKAYYVIDKDSPERANVDKYGNVIYFKTKSHIWKTIMATKVLASHHPNYLYPIRTRKFSSKVHALKVFLQHGVMGTKNMVSNYGKRANGFEADLFLVSSDLEKKMIINDFGYEENEVAVTGLSRFDSLFEGDLPLKRQILIIPTWRDWIGDHLNRFLESEYYKRYNELIHHSRLEQLASNYSFDIIFCLHPNMQKYTPYFKDARVKVINQGEMDVQTLLKESMFMVTDYSSVGFDFSFLQKPVVYYQFDQEKFIGSRPSHLNLERDLPGEMTNQVDDLLDLIEDYAKTDFKMKETYVKRSEKFLKYKDQQSNKRIYEIIQSKKTARQS